MPTAYVSKLAKAKGMPLSEAERRWDSAKRVAKEAGKAEDYAYITGLFKRMMGETSAVGRLAVTASLDAQTFEQKIHLYQGSEESKALAFRFCREFEPLLLALGFEFSNTCGGNIAEAAWVSTQAHKIQDAVTLFNKSGITFEMCKLDNALIKYHVKSSMVLPRFGGLTTIQLMTYADGVAGIAVSFSYFGL